METDWSAFELVAAVAAADTVFVCATCGVGSVWDAAGGAELSEEPPDDPDPAGSVPEAGCVEPAGSPVHVQFHTHEQPQAWVSEKLDVVPFEPVHVQFQIHWPATGAGPDEAVGLDVDPALELSLPESLLDDSFPAAGVEVCESIHDQTQEALAVDAWSALVGATLNVQTQFHVHASIPVGTTTSVPGRTTLTLMPLWPFVVALAVAAVAVDAFDWEAISSAPGLPIRTDTLTFVAFD
jgi:hypothetical protein